jgi:hypothetical protein
MFIVTLGITKINLVGKQGGIGKIVAKHVGIVSLVTKWLKQRRKALSRNTIRLTTGYRIHSRLFLFEKI